MDEIDDGGAAFPLLGFADGMSLRDYFAGQALEILLKHGTEAFPQFKNVADECYRFADAMLKARSKKPEAK